MSEKTKIEWCDHTWNPWRGCAKVSPGCQNCYAEGWGKRFGVEWGPGKPRKLGSAAYRRQPLRWQDFQYWRPNCNTGVRDPEALGNPFLCPNCDPHEVLTQRRPRVFCGSLMDDWLDPEVPVEWLADLIDTIRQTPNLDWLLLTKRPEKWRLRIEQAMEWWAGKDGATYSCMADWFQGKAPANVWLGVSAEDQTRWGERVPVLLSIPAAVRFVSVEPMLGPIEMWGYWGQRPDWIILGGESGPKARPCNVEWIRRGVSQCREAGVPVFVKQLGARPYNGGSSDMYDECVGTAIHYQNRKGGDPAEWPGDLRVREFPQ
jgi:protein gp37